MDISPRHFSDTIEDGKMDGIENKQFLAICATAWKYKQGTKLMTVTMEMESQCGSEQHPGGMNVWQLNDVALIEEFDDSTLVFLDYSISSLRVK